MIRKQACSTVTAFALSAGLLAANLGWVGPLRAEAPQAAIEKVVAESVSEPGSSVSWGRAETIVNASTEQVRAIVRDYDNYAQFLPHFEKSKVLSQRGAAALVYMQAKVAYGAVTIWAQMKMSAQTDAEGREVVEARMMKGNITRMDARWELTPMADGRTRVTFQMRIDPDLPLPNSLINSENLKASKRTLEALHKRLAQGGALASR